MWPHLSAAGLWLPSSHSRSRQIVHVLPASPSPAAAAPAVSAAVAAVSVPALGAAAGGGIAAAPAAPAAAAAAGAAAASAVRAGKHNARDCCRFVKVCMACTSAAELWPAGTVCMGMLAVDTLAVLLCNNSLNSQQPKPCCDNRIYQSSKHAHHHPAAGSKSIGSIGSYQLAALHPHPPVLVAPPHLKQQ
jgi:hypothetical protein